MKKVISYLTLMSLIAIAPFSSLYALPKADGYSPKNAPKMPAPPSPPKPVIVPPPPPLSPLPPKPTINPAPPSSPIVCNELKEIQFIKGSPGLLEEGPEFSKYNTPEYVNSYIGASIAKFIADRGNAARLGDDFMKEVGDSVISLTFEAYVSYPSANNETIKAGMMEFSSANVKCFPDSYMGDNSRIRCDATAKQFNDAFASSSLQLKSTAGLLKSVREKTGSASVLIRVASYSDFNKKFPCLVMNQMLDIR